jgi:HAD superfamily hydrolase (TIGR01509 family)
MAAMAAFDAVLFDIGNTLVYRRGEATALIECAATLGVQLSTPDAEMLWAAVQAEARTPAAMSSGRDLSPEAHRREWQRLWEPAEAIAPGLSGAMAACEADPEYWLLYPDVADVLDALDARQVPLGLVSDTGWDFTTVLARYGLASRFDVAVMSFQHGVVKPAATLFTAACDALGVAPSATLMVGDNALPDGGAVDAGLSVLLLPAVAAGTPRGLSSVLALVDGVRVQ